MKYFSTRSGSERVSAAEAIIRGLAPDGGLYVPESIPCLSPDDFAELVKERERIAPTAFGNLVALPHPMRAVSKRTFVTVGLLDEPVTWAGHEVWGVFLISLAAERDLDLNAFYHTLLRVLMDTDAVRELLEDRRFETLLALVRKQQRREVGSV